MRRRFEDENCAVAQALGILGDGWTMLIIREAFLGTRRFGDFQSNLGVAKNVLAQRLQHLVDHQIMETVDVGRYGRRFEYELTPRGKDLITLVTALRQWGDRWIYGKGGEPLIIRDRRTHKRIPRLRLVDESGRPLRGSDLVLEPGPGASAETHARFAAIDDSER